MEDNLLTTVDLKNFVLCPICFSTFNDPVVTNCQHSFCRPCITSSLSATRGSCPLCRHYVSIESLKSNLVVKQLMSTLPSSKTKKSFPPSPIMLASFDKVIQLSLTEDYAPHWNSRAGIREIVQNWYDGMLEKVQFLDEFYITKQDSDYEFEEWTGSCRGTVLGKLTYLHQEKTLQFVNHQTGLDRKVLLLGTSSKRDQQHLVGQFGEGLKVGILALLREGKFVTIQTKGEIWKFCLLEDANFDNQRVLSVRILEVSITDITCSTVSGISYSQWRDQCRDFLFLNGVVKKTRTSAGTLLHDPQYDHKLYVKSFWITDMKDEGLVTGVDIPNLVLDRDRRAVVKRAELDNIVAQIWSQAIVTDEQLVPLFYDMLMKGNSMLSNAPWIITEGGVTLLANYFFQQQGEDAYPVLNTNKDDIFLVESELNLKAVLCPQAMSDILHSSQRVRSTTEQLKKIRERQLVEMPLMNQEHINLLKTVTTVIQDSIDPSFMLLYLQVVQFNNDKSELVRLDPERKEGFQISHLLLSIDYVHRKFRRCTETQQGGGGGGQKNKCACREVQILLGLAKAKSEGHYNNKLMQEQYYLLLCERIMQSLLACFNRL